MNPIAVAFRPTRASIVVIGLVIGLLLGYAGLLSTSAAADDEVISRVELLE
jgi:LPS O-antigen subunit length determinant protein (WzzB/FepE family)